MSQQINMGNSEPPAAWKAVKPFLTGSMSGMVATTCIQPIDMIKVRIQVNAGSGGSTNPIAIAGTMIKEEGFSSLYNGLSAGLTRQVVYTGARLGLYDYFTTMAKSPGEESISFAKTSLCALAAGGLGAVAGNPADLSLIRMQTDSMLPAEQRVNFKHVGHAFTDIIAKEGFVGMFAGVAPTAGRAMCLNLGMLAGNSKAKDLLVSMGCEKGSATTVNGAAALAGFLGAALSLPADFVKTQMQKQKPDPTTGKLQYSSAVDCVKQTFAAGGPMKFYAGFPTYYVRIAPHAMITLIAQDKFKKMWSSAGL